MGIDPNVLIIAFFFVLGGDFDINNRVQIQHEYKM